LEFHFVPFMTGPNDRHENIVPVDSPPPPEEKPADLKTREAVRIQLPIRDAREVASAGPRTETARVSSVPVVRSPAAEIKNPQAFVSESGIAAGSRLVPGAPTEKDPKLVWWILLGLSALILIIQIWTYIS
jgi:hypothetical protein